MNINVVSLFGKELAVHINFFNGYLSIVGFNSDRKNFTPSGPVCNVSIKPSTLTKLGRVCRDLVAAPMGATKSLLCRKYNNEAGQFVNTLVISITKELQKYSLYSLNIHFVEKDIKFHFDFTEDPTVLVTSEDETIEQKSSDSFLDFFSVFNPNNLSILKGLSLDSKVITTTTKSTKMTTTSVPGNDFTKPDEDVPF